MKIILFRHGEKERVSNTKGDISIVRLTDNGINQINKLGRVIYEKFPELINCSTIYSSLYARSLQSAQIVQSVLNIKEVVQIPEFGEFTAYNNYQNSKEKRESLQLQAVQNPDWVSPETHLSLSQNITIFTDKIKELCLKGDDDPILISTHGGIIRHTVYSLDPKHRPGNDFIIRSKIKEAGYTVLNYNGDNFFVDEFNVHDFL